MARVELLLNESLSIVVSIGRAIDGVNTTIQYVPPSGSLNRFGHALNWFFVAMMVLSGTVYFVNGIRYDTVSAGAPLFGPNATIRQSPEAVSTLRKTN